MRLRWKALLAAVGVLLALLAVNTILTNAETKGAEVTVPGGELLKLPAGEVQIVDRGPRRGSPIVLIHGYTAAIDWWSRMMPYLVRRHRVIAIDLLGHGGSEKPDTGYSMEDQASLVAQAMRRLGVSGATVVGHSMGGVVATALLEEAPQLVARLAIVDQAPDGSYGIRNLLLELSLAPMLGQAAWQLAPDWSIEDGLSKGFAPGYEVPDAFVEDFRRLTFTAYDESAEAEISYSDEQPLDERLAATRVPLLVIFGAEDQFYDSERALRAYAATVPRAQTRLLAGAGHSPNVEKPALTARLVLDFAEGPVHRNDRARKRVARMGDPIEKPAATYSPRRLPSKYHRR